MPRRIAYRARAREDLVAIYEYIRDQSGSPVAGRRFVRLIQAKCNVLTDFPLLGRVRQELRPPYRTLSVARRVTIVYRVSPKTVQIIRVLYGGRDLERALR